MSNCLFLRWQWFKLIFCPGSGGWSYPKPGNAANADLPKFQLYYLGQDPSEENNLFMENPGKADELARLMKAYVENGRSTPGAKQANAPLHLNGKEWHQIEPILSY